VRKFLRIAVTALSLAACLTIVTFWVRSKSTRDVVYGWFPFPGYLQLDSNRSCIKLIANLEHQDASWKFDSSPLEALLRSWYFSVVSHPDYGWWLDLTVPHWLPALLFAMLAAAPWMKWRFTVRGVLVATTIVAAILGVAVATN